VVARFQGILTVKDLTDVVFKNLATYLPVLGRVVSAPKRSVATLIEGDDRLEKALVFGCITAALGFILQAPLLRVGEDFVVLTGSMFVIKLLSILAFSGAVFAAFRMFGGKGHYLTTLCAYLYVVSPLYLFFTIVDLAMLGLLSSNPDMTESWNAGWVLTQAHIDTLVRETPGRAATLALLGWVLILSTPIWFGICWGAFRAIHGVSLPRSIVAFLTAGILCWAIFATSVWIMRGLHGGVLPSIT
jgi:hypothetical protein